MKHWISRFVITLFGITLLTGCGGSDTPTPEDEITAVVSQMFDAMTALDFDAVGACLTPEEAKQIEPMKAMMKMVPAEEQEKQKAKMADATISFGAVVITGDTATCETTVKGMAGEEEQTDIVKLTKVDGKWYISSMRQ